MDSPPIHVRSVHFAHAESPAIRLRSSEGDRLIGELPEWTSSCKGTEPRREPAGYVRGASATVIVELLGPPGEEMMIGADASATAVASDGPTPSPVAPGFPGLAEMLVTFDQEGSSGPVQFELTKPLPSTQGRFNLRWTWYTVDGKKKEQVTPPTEHEILLTFKELLPAWSWLDKPEPKRSEKEHYLWAYARVVRWTCEWTAGLPSESSDREICEAIIGNVAKSGMQYAQSAYTVRDMLNNDPPGGWCGGWYKMFQAMAATQGVYVHRRHFWVDWRDLGEEEVSWCAIVIRHPGTNRTVPGMSASTYHDYSWGDDRPNTVTEHRYRFWGAPPTFVGGTLVPHARDGHCINFLQDGDNLVLYDTCFFTQGIDLKGMEMPKGNYKNPASTTPTIAAIPVSEMPEFKERYLDRAVDYMLGSIRLGGELYKTSPDGESNGLAVRTSSLDRTGPSQVSEQPEKYHISFYWG